MSGRRPRQLPGVRSTSELRQPSKVTRTTPGERARISTANAAALVAKAEAQRRRVARLRDEGADDHFIEEIYRDD